jgi:protein-disulfide isomerase
MMKNDFYLAILILSFLAALAPGCRFAFEGDDYQPPDYNEFDASMDDQDASPLALCPEGTPDLFNNAYSPYFGGEESVDLEVITFSSFNCYHCAAWAKDSREIWERRPDFQARVRLYFHHFILWNVESEWDRHRAAVAAYNQGMENFWKMHDLIYDGMNQAPPVTYTLEDLTAYARDVLNLDMDEFNADLNSDETISFLYWDKEQGYEAGVQGTPSIFICGEKVLQSQVEDLLDYYLGN